MLGGRYKDLRLSAFGINMEDLKAKLRARHIILPIITQDFQESCGVKYIPCKRGGGRYKRRVIRMHSLIHHAADREYKILQSLPGMALSLVGAHLVASEINRVNCLPSYFSFVHTSPILSLPLLYSNAIAHAKGGSRLGFLTKSPQTGRRLRSR